MITISSTVGNIYRDENLRRRYEEMSSRSLCESIMVNRIEAQRVRMRKTSNKGTDIALTMAPGTKLWLPPRCSWCHGQCDIGPVI